MRKLMILAVAAATMIVGSAVAYACADEGDARLPDDRERHAQLNKTFKEGVKSGSAWNMIAVSHHDIGGRGNNADVYVHKSIAYVGHCSTNSCPASGRCRRRSAARGCGSTERPRHVAQEIVVVYTAQSGSARGRDIAVASNQVCGDRYDRTTKRGITLWDVTDPHHPFELGRYDTGCCSRGVHEFEVAYRADLKKTYAFVAVPFAELDDPASPNGVRDLAGKGEFRIIDITNPASPVEVAEWGARKRLGLALDRRRPGLLPCTTSGTAPSPPTTGRRCTSPTGDAGFMAFDVTNPASPHLISTAKVGPREDVDAHSSSYDDARKLLFTGDEDFCKAGDHVEKGFGYMRVWGTTATRPRRGRSAPTGRRTRPAQPTPERAITRCTTRSSRGRTSTSRGTRTGSASSTRAIRQLRGRWRTSSHRRRTRRIHRRTGTRCRRTRHRCGASPTTRPPGLVYGSDMNSGALVLAGTDR